MSILEGIGRAVGAVAETAADAVEAADQWWADGAWHYVSSSNVEGFRYDAKAQILDMSFLKGSRKYRYHNIPIGMARELANTSSPGGWWHANLKGAPFERL